MLLVRGRGRCFIMLGFWLISRLVSRLRVMRRLVVVPTIIATITTTMPDQRQESTERVNTTEHDRS